MTPEEFKIWRKRLHLTQIDAAVALGMTARAIKHYEAGTRGISQSIELLTVGVEKSYWRGKQKSKGVHDFYDPRDIVPTPQPFFDRLHAEFQFDLDVCALPGNAKCDRFFTPETNGLDQEWNGSVWMNPPYFQGRIAKWIAKAYEEVEAGRAAVAVSLVHVVNDTRWWHQFVLKASEIRFVRGRLDGYGRSVVVVFRRGDHSAVTSTMTAKVSP